MGSPGRHATHRQLSITLSMNWRHVRPTRSVSAGPAAGAGERPATLLWTALIVGACGAALVCVIWPALVGPVSVALMAPPSVAAALQLPITSRHRGVTGRHWSAAIAAWSARISRRRCRR